MKTKKPSLGPSLLLGLGLATVLVAGCSGETSDPGDESALDGADPGMSRDDEPTASISSELGGCGQCTNCVLYARCRQPRLPFGLTTYADKVRSINQHTPRAGCVAVIKTTSVYGHVAYVNGVSGGGVHIDEGNWPSGHCGTRFGTPAALHISGYICP